MQSALAVFLLLFAGSLHASLVTSVSAAGDFLDGFAPAFGCSQGGTAGSECNVSVPGDVYHFAAGAYSAAAQYGVLDVRSSSNTYIHAELWGNAIASFTDSLTITGSHGVGTIVFGVEYWGLLHGDYCGDGYTCEQNTQVDFGGLHVHPSNHTGTVYDVSYAFTFGVPLTITASASAFSTAYSHEFEDLSAHFQIDSARVFVGGNELSGYSAAAASGTVYPFVGDPPAAPMTNPEPGTYGVVLVAAGLLLGVSRGRVKDRL